MNIIQYVKYFFLLALAWLPLALSGCITKTSSGGYVNDLDIREEVVIGQTTREEVRERLGSPSSHSSFGQETWYYISERTEAVAFFKPEVVEQQVIRIEFDDDGIVRTVKHLDINDGREFDYVRRSTPTEGHSMGIVEQLLGNVGRFNRDPNARRPGGI